MSDRRQEILNCHIDNHPTHGLSIEQERIAIGAMDEYMKECCLEFLDFVGKHLVSVDRVGDVVYFKYNNEWLTKEELFENFL